MKPRHSITLLQKIANRTQATYLLAFLIHHPICSHTHCTVTDGQTDGRTVVAALMNCTHVIDVLASCPLPCLPWRLSRDPGNHVESVGRPLNRPPRHTGVMASHRGLITPPKQKQAATFGGAAFVTVKAHQIAEL